MALLFFGISNAYSAPGYSYAGVCYESSTALLDAFNLKFSQLDPASNAPLTLISSTVSSPPNPTVSYVAKSRVSSVNYSFVPFTCDTSNYVATEHDLLIAGFSILMIFVGFIAGFRSILF